MTPSFVQLLKFEIKSITANATNILTSVLFFIISNSIFMYILASNPESLKKAGPIMIWVTGLLSIFNACQHMVKEDRENGFIQRAQISNTPITSFLYAKLATYWFFSGFIICALTIPISIFYGIDIPSARRLMISMAISTIIISLLYHFVLIISEKTNGYLTTILILPLCLPIIILSLLHMNETGHSPYLTALWGLLFIYAPFYHFFASKALK